MKIYNIEQNLIGTQKNYFVYKDINEEYLHIKSRGINSFLDRICGSIFSVGHYLYITNINGSEYVTIKKNYGLLLEKYDVLDNGIKIGEIKQSMLSKKPKFEILTESNTYEITGDIMAKDFVVKKDNIVAAKISKRTFNIKDIYNLEIFDLYSEKLMIASVICIDKSIHN